MSFLSCPHFLPFLVFLLGIFSSCKGDFGQDIEDATNLSLGVFVGVVIGVLLLAIALIVLTCFICTCCCFKKHDKIKEPKSRILRSNLSNHSSVQNYSTGLESPLPQYVGYELEDVPRPFTLQPAPPGKPRDIPYAKPVPVSGGILKNTQGFQMTHPVHTEYPQGRKIPPAVPPKPAYTRNYPQQAAWEEVNKRLKKDFIEDPRNPPPPDY